MLAQAAEADAHEDERHGESRGDELPAGLADRERRLTRLKAAKAKLSASSTTSRGRIVRASSSGRGGRRSSPRAGGCRGPSRRRRRPRSRPRPRST